MREKKPTIPCRECKAEIGFVKTRKGAKMPVNAESFTEEDIELLNVGATVDFRYGDHISHFDTCPAAKEFRKKKD